MRKIQIVFALLAGVAMTAAQPALRAPMSGFVYDTLSRSLRPVHGVPGAGYLGARLELELDYAQVSPDGRLALGVSGGSLARIALETPEPAVTLIEGAIGAVERIAWSPDSSVAVIYSTATHRLQRLTRLNGTPLADEPLDLAPWGERVTTLAVGDAAQIAVGIEGAGLLLIAAGQTPLAIGILDRADSAVFASGVLYAADRAARRIIEVRNLTGSPEATLFADETNGVEDPAGLGLAGGTLVVASPSGRAIDLFGVADRRLVERVVVESVPTGIEPLGRMLLFARPQRADEPLWILDIAGESPRAYFIPASL